MSRHWRIADGIAWVGETGRVALIDTRSGTSSPMLVPPLFAELWRSLSEGPLPESDLQVLADDLVEDSGSELAQAFLDALSGQRVIESVDADA